MSTALWMRKYNKGTDTTQRKKQIPYTTKNWISSGHLLTQSLSRQVLYHPVIIRSPPPCSVSKRLTDCLLSKLYYMCDLLETWSSTRSSLTVSEHLCDLQQWKDRLSLSGVSEGSNRHGPCDQTAHCPMTTALKVMLKRIELDNQWHQTWVSPHSVVSERPL